MLFPQPKRKIHKNSIVCESVFSDSECDQIISLGIDMKDAYIGDKDGRLKENSSIRRSKIKWIERDDKNFWIYKKISDVALKANIDVFGFNISGLGEMAQLTKYESEQGGHYDWHQDIGPNDMSIRKLSVVAMLSKKEDFGGGELEIFTEKPSQIKINRGSMVVFPSYEPHRVREVISGTRWSLVCWVSGPPFI